ncbi:MAG TPA: GWxTD domain-containing protein [Thermoanaerobaculia bacterium]|nr:GWxTD domain-containing protein [Thermoanaerobaculia bacterium]
MTLSRFLLPCLFLLTTAGAPLRAQAPAAADDEDWAKSPEAYFLTSDEKREWQRLASRENRQEFIERYWLKRDPSPGTPANEFHDLVLNRIRTADGRYRIEKTSGSRTAQGFVFIVFGTPARVQEQRARGPEAPRNPVAGAPNNPVGLIEGTEMVYTWNYERDRTPRVLEALGIPTLSINIVVEPQRHRDELQKPGLVNDYRERLARKSIVNPDLVPAAAAGHPAPVAAAAASTILPLSREARAVLEKALPQGPVEDEKRPIFGSAILWGDRSAPETLTWVYFPGKDGGAEKMRFHALVRPQEGGPEILAGTEAVAPSTTLPTAKPGRVLMRRLDLPPGNYSASLAVTDEKDRPLASATLPLRVPALEKDLAVSSLLLSAGVAPVDASGDGSFVFGTVEVLPRADAEFSRSESLWYFVQLANVDDAEKITQEIQLRRGAQTIASQAASPAKLQQLAPGRYAFGYEIPLTGLAPGNYMLYVTVRDGTGHSTLRRADFRVVEGPTKVSAALN